MALRILPSASMLYILTIPAYVQQSLLLTPGNDRIATSAEQSLF